MTHRSSDGLDSKGRWYLVIEHARQNATVRDSHLLSQLLRFGAMGVISLSIGIGATAFAHEVLGASEYVAGAAGFSVLLIFGYVSSRVFVFAANGRLRDESTRFFVAAAASRAGEYGLYSLLIWVAHSHYISAMLCTIAVSFLGKFWIYKTWVFRK